MRSKERDGESRNQRGEEYFRLAPSDYLVSLPELKCNYSRELLWYRESGWREGEMRSTPKVRPLKYKTGTPWITQKTATPWFNHPMGPTGRGNKQVLRP